MIYTYAITTPANTAIAAPLKTVAKLEKGTVILKYLLFPPGCAGLVGAQIYDALHQVWPTNRGVWFRGEGLLKFDDRYPLRQEPFELDILTYNLDDTFNHEPIIYLNLERPDQWVEVTKKVELSPEYLEEWGGL